MTKKFEKISLFEPYFRKEELSAVSDAIKSSFWASGAGIGKVSEFEKNFARYVGCRQVIAVNSGTAALHLALAAIGISKKMVLVPSLTFVSTAHAVIYNDAKPKFVDVDPSTLCIDISDLEDKITENVVAIMPVHFGGYPCNIEKLDKIRRKHGIHIVEDAAHACGAKYNGKKIGTHSDLVCFSFHPVKNLAMPTGGAIAINSPSTDTSLLKSLRWCGITDRKGSMYNVNKLGWNFYMNEISAAIGLVQLKRLDKMNRVRREIAKRYHSEIKVVYKMPFSQNCSYHLYWIRVKNRNEFMKNMSRKGIETGIHYKPIHLMKYYSGSPQLKNSERIWEELVSIPMHANLSADDVERVIQTVNSLSK